MDKMRIGITIGDINGVGLEVILKTLANPNITQTCIPVIYGSSKVVSYHRNIVGIENFPTHNVSSAERLKYDRVNLVNCWQEDVNISLGQMSDGSGKYAKISLEQATNDLKQGYIDAIVTAPFNKKAMNNAGFRFPGHTEYFTATYELEDSLMLMVHDDLRVGVVTNHLPLSEVAGAITKELVRFKLKTLNKTLKQDFGIEKPIIAVLGLNPHAGDDGLIGKEEEEIIRPVIIEAKKKGVMVMGPFPADGFFGSGQHRKVDAVLAMYHDQGLVPFKALSFGAGVNFTAGLPGVRTSPDHGTAYNIAGKNEADPSSFRQALFLSIDIARNRRAYIDMHSNPMVKKNKKGTEVHQEGDTME